MTRGGGRSLAAAIGALVIAAVLLAAAIVLSRGGGGIVQRTVDSGFSATLEGVRDIGELETIAWVREVVFPHDFLLPGVSAMELVRRVGSAGAPADEVLTPAERAHLDATNLALDLALATSREDPRFVVVTTVTSVGYDVTSIGARIDDAGAVRVRLPEARILETRVEDVDPDAYAFGAIRLDADGWARVSAFVSERALADAPTEQLLEDARAGAERVLRALFGTDAIIVR